MLKTTIIKTLCQQAGSGLARLNKPTFKIIQFNLTHKKKKVQFSAVVLLPQVDLLQNIANLQLRPHVMLKLVSYRKQFS